ncbi:hypothetical protein ABIB62_004425 [Mucilaginibacter sp. UYP25]|uniref:hypothetical protein n=1 Tax=unclassified Mucilaginibacter TaxID=2617802 RepID=UPI00339B4DF3
MKNIILILLSIVLLSCKKDDNFPRTEIISSGSKWNIQIGSSASDVYKQIQQLGTEKHFSYLAIVGQGPFSKPEDLQSRLPFYDAITLSTSTGVIQRAVIAFKADQVSSIEVGGALPVETDKWPQDAPGNTAIQKGDALTVLYSKLLTIHQLPSFADYQLVLPDKTLSKALDPNMLNYTQWAFTFALNVRPGRSGTSAVVLYFKDGKLEKIRHDYNESDVYN